MKNILITVLIVTFSISNAQAAGTDDFITIWEPVSSDGYSITLPIEGGPYDVDWEDDGTFDSVGVSGSQTHAYGAAGAYTVRVQGVNGSYTRFRTASDTANAEKLLDVTQWGTQTWTSMLGAFGSASNLTLTATDIPNFSSVSNMQSMFHAATSANPDTSNWDTSAVVTMRAMFDGAQSANPDTSGWNTSAVEDMGSMFYGATSANPDTSGWNTSAVEDMNFMFYRATSANPDTSGWNTSAVMDMTSMFADTTSANPDTSNWDTSAVLFMVSMFAYNTSANPDTSNWDTSAVVDMVRMFNGATSANPDTSGWDTSAVDRMSFMFSNAQSANPDTSNWDTSGVTAMLAMFSNAQSANPDTSGWTVTALVDASEMFLDATSFTTTSYDNMLISWGSQTLRGGVRLGVGNTVYCSVGAVNAHISMIGHYGWVINDGGVCPPPSLPTAAPDLTAETDSGTSDSDNVTADSTPDFEVVCSQAPSTITLYSDVPSSNTVIGSFACTVAGSAIVTVSVSLSDTIHNISYTETNGGGESQNSASLPVTIDTAVAEVTCVTRPTPALIGALITTTCTGVEELATVTIPEMKCTPTPADASGTVDCTGTVGEEGVSQPDDTVTVVDLSGNIDTSATTGLVIKTIVAPIPTMSEWGVVMLSGLLGLIGFGRRRNV